MSSLTCLMVARKGGLAADLALAALARVGCHGGSLGGGADGHEHKR